MQLNLPIILSIAYIIRGDCKGCHGTSSSNKKASQDPWSLAVVNSSRECFSDLKLSSIVVIIFSMGTKPIMKQSVDWGVFDRGIEELAASACHDKHGRNRSRNLYSYIHKRKRTLQIQITAVDIPVQIRRPVKVVKKSWPVLHLPSWLHTTMEDPKYGGFFFLGGKTLDHMDEVRRMFSTFWTRYNKTHPGSMPASPETTIPILIHGDEGRSLCKRPVMIVSFQCIIPWSGENNPNNSQMLAYAISKHFVIFN